MKHHPAALILIVAAALFTAFPSLSLADERFGPWVYYAPYYYPRDMVFAGRLFCPEDFAPRYESPNPPQPSNACPPGMIGNQRPPAKVSGRGMHAGLGNAPGSARDQGSVSALRSPSQPIRAHNPSPPSFHRSVPRDTTSIRPSAPEMPAKAYAPRETLPRPSTPGAGPDRSAMPQPPAAQRQTFEQPAPPAYVPEKPAVQHAMPAVPDNAFKQLNRPVEQLESPDTYRAPGSPAHRAGTYSAPAAKTVTQPEGTGQAHTENGSAKKPWTWGRPTPGNRERPQQVAPSGPGSRDQRL